MLVQFSDRTLVDEKRAVNPSRAQVTTSCELSWLRRPFRCWLGPTPAMVKMIIVASMKTFALLKNRLLNTLYQWPDTNRSDHDAVGAYFSTTTATLVAAGECTKSVNWCTRLKPSE
jgi:hypothetical protein